MIFRKNKPADGPDDDNHTLRGRDSEPGKRGANALARRFLVDDEPETIDLAGGGGFHESAPEPETRVTSEAPADTGSQDRQALLSHDPETGKFYVRPGTPESPVLLNGAVVDSTTELRKGDRIAMAGAEFELL